MSDDKEVKKDDLLVAEQQDGSVTVEGIEDVPEDEQNDAPQQKAEGGEVVPEDGGEDHPDDTEAIRSARREKRKAKKLYQREQQREKDARYNQLVRQNQELMQRLQAVEQRTHGSELARIDKAIEDQQLRIQYAKMKISEATQAQDGEAMSNAQDMLYEARRMAEQLDALKKQASAPAPAQAIAPDRAVQRQAAAWMERNSWYDPGGKDEDSQIALIVDKKMAAEGWSPADPDYWEELDSRLQKRLPHIYNGEERQERETPVRRPRSVVTGSGRENAASSGGSKTSFTLSPDQVKAMKDAGLWDDPEKRAKMIRRYATETRQMRSN
jgi:hypothetical protein